MMPRLGGDQLVQAMRAEPALADVPVLVVSAKDDPVLRTRLLDARVQDYVTKPFSAQELRGARNLTTMKLARDALRRELASHSADLTQLTHELIDSRRALQASQLRWQAMFQHSPVGIALADDQGRILSANPALQAMLGYTESELRRMTLMRITPVEDRARRAGGLVGVLEQRREVHVQRRFQHRQGALVARVACVAADRDERRAAVHRRGGRGRDRAPPCRGGAGPRPQRAGAGDNAHHCWASWSVSIAHEVNQPLAAIVANGQAAERWMDRRCRRPEARRAIVQRIVRDANRAGEVVARVRRLRRQGELQREPLRADQWWTRCSTSSAWKRKPPALRCCTSRRAACPKCGPTGCRCSRSC